MQYISTRGLDNKTYDYEFALMKGTTGDGGLLAPEFYPQFNQEFFTAIGASSYVDGARRIMQPFMGDLIPPTPFKNMLAETYNTEAFPVKGVTPMHFLPNGMGVLELFHGPTLAFKDVALQLLGREFEYVLEKNGGFMNILGATSGDTGSAAIAGCRNKKNINIFIIHPQGRTSPVQRLQMTSVLDPNVFNMAIQGTFDDGQNIVKGCLNDLDFKDKYQLTPINSINQGRIIAQVVYFARTAAKYGTKDRPIDFVVPTGNFGDILACWIAKQMGAPIGKLVCASNANDILHRFVQTGTMATAAKVAQTPSPSMDIQVSSNFERWLFDAVNRDPEKVIHYMSALNKTGQFTVDAACKAKVDETFLSGTASNQQTLDQIAQTYTKFKYVADPHTAVGLHVANDLIQQGKLKPETTICLATAHPAKFPDIVQEATGKTPPLPAHLANIYKRPERCLVVPNDAIEVRRYIMANALQ